MFKARGGGGSSSTSTGSSTFKKKSNSKKKQCLKWMIKKCSILISNCNPFYFLGEQNKPTTTTITSSSSKRADRKFVPTLINDEFGNVDTDILVPLVPFVY